MVSLFVRFAEGRTREDRSMRYQPFDKAMDDAGFPESAAVAAFEKKYKLDPMTSGVLAAHAREARQQLEEVHRVLIHSNRLGSVGGLRLEAEAADAIGLVNKLVIGLEMIEREAADALNG